MAVWAASEFERLLPLRRGRGGLGARFVGDCGPFSAHINIQSATAPPLRVRALGPAEGRALRSATPGEVKAEVSAGDALDVVNRKLACGGGGGGVVVVARSLTSGDVSRS